MTFGSLFKKPSTTRYPFERKPQPVGLKGQIGIDVDQCILCGMCDKSCTTGAITVSKPERLWQINRFRCVQCGYCILVCPKTCLSMLPDYASVAPEKSTDTFSVPEKEKTTGTKAAKTASSVKEQDSLKQSEEKIREKAIDKALVPSTEAAEITETHDQTATQFDHQLQDLIELMDDEEKKHKVRQAFEDFTDKV